MKTIITQKLLAVCLVIGAVIIPFVSISAQSEIVYFQDFENGHPPDWDMEDGWEVIAYEDGHVLSGQGHTWATAGIGSWKDYVFRFRVMLEPDAQLHANIRLDFDPFHRYFITVNRAQVVINKQVDDEFYEGLSTGPGPGSGWHLVEIRAEGAEVSVRWDDNEPIRYEDPDPIPHGGIAFESVGSGVVLIDDVEVEREITESEQQMIEDLQALGELSWVRTGGPLGGLGYDVRMHPENPQIMYVTDAYAGVHISEDGGQTWSPSNEGISARSGMSGESIPVFCLTVDPNNPDVIWAGTQSIKGIYKSLDGGSTWQKKDSGVLEQEITFRGFTVEPGNSDVVYAAAEISSWQWNDEPLNGREFDMVKGVVYKTTDGGETWQAVWRGDNLARYIWIDPGNTDVLYVSTGIFDREAANSDPDTGTPGGVGVVKSTDGGETWREINQGLDNLYVGSLFMQPENPDILLAGTGNVQYLQHAGVYLSVNGGESWHQTLQAGVINSVEFAPSNPDIAYAGGFEAIYRSEDGGMQWDMVTENPPWGPPGTQAGHPIDIEIDPDDPDRVFINNYGGGNFLSEDGGHTWVNASRGYTGAQVRDVVVDPFAPGRVIVVARSGVFVSYSGGDTWTGIAHPPFKTLDWHAIALDPSDPQHMVADLTCDGALVNSTGGGQRWQLVHRSSGKWAWKTIAFAPSDPNIVYAGSAGYFSCGQFDTSQPSSGVFRSVDGGASWEDANDDLSQDAVVNDLAVDGTDGNMVYAATMNHGVLKSEDGGTSWRELSSGLPGEDAASVAVSPFDSNLVLVGYWGGGLYRSVDSGETWQNVPAGLPPEALISDILFDPSNPDVVYLTDLQSGVYRSGDGGETWVVIQEGLRNRSVNALAISADGLHLYAATEGEGVYRLDLNGQPPPAAPEPTLETTKEMDDEEIPQETQEIESDPVPTSTSRPEPAEVGKDEEAPEEGGNQFPCLGGLLPLGFLGLVLFRRRRR